MVARMGCGVGKLHPERDEDEEFRLPAIGPPRFELGQAVPKTAVLPLHHGPVAGGRNLYVTPSGEDHGGVIRASTNDPMGTRTSPERPHRPRPDANRGEMSWNVRVAAMERPMWCRRTIRPHHGSCKSTIVDGPKRPSTQSTSDCFREGGGGRILALRSLRIILKTGHGGTLQIFRHVI